jgi:hypothetical protein
MSDESVKEETKQENLKGFSLVVTGEGKVVLQPVNVNELELIALLDYANQKKQEMLQVISNAPEHRTVVELGKLSNVLTQVFQAAHKQVEAKVASPDS